MNGDKPTQLERNDPLLRTPSRGGSTRSGDQGCVIRFEKRAGECIHVVRAKPIKGAAAGKPKSPQPLRVARGGVSKARGITWIRPETE